MKLTSSIRPVIRLDKKKLDGTCPIHFSIRVGNHTTRIPSGKFCKANEWDTKNNSAKKNTAHGLLLSTYLSKKVSDYNYFILEQQSLGKQITLNIAMDHFKENAKIDLFTFWNEQMELWKDTKSENTIKSYQSTLRIIKLFNNKLNFGDLSLNFVQKFDNHMRNKRNNATNGCFVKHKCLKAIINQAIMHGYMIDNPYRYFKNRTTPGTRKFLTIEEMKLLLQPEMHKTTQMQILVKDLFLFSCFTGLRYSDLMNLKLQNIKANPARIELTIQKTNKTLTIPISSHAQEIIDKYNKLVIKPPTHAVFPQVSNPVVNRNLKDIMEAYQINKSISFHCARHTFASNLVEAKTSILYIKDLLGHSKLDQTQIYAKSLTSDLFNSVDKLDDLYNHAV